MKATKSRKRNIYIYISKEKGNVKHFDSLVKFCKKKNNFGLNFYESHI